jgi:hypothetical protein
VCGWRLRAIALRRPAAFWNALQQSSTFGSEALPRL